MIELIQRGPRFWKYRFLWWLTENFDYTPKAPLHVDIELTNQCNLKCVMCPQGDENWKPQKGMMSKEMAKSIIDQCVILGVFSIKLQFRGESALHKDLPEIIAYAKNEGILEVQMNTNGIPYTKTKVRKMVAAGLDRLIVSVDGATPKTYAKIRIGGKLSDVKRTLGWFRSIKGQLKTRRPYIRLQMTQQEDNRHEAQEFREKWKEYADEINVKQVRSWNTGERKSCPQPRQRLVVGWNGECYGCCNAWNEESFIWRGTLLNQIMLSTKRLRLISLAEDPSKGEPCKSCQVRSSYK